MVTLPPSPGVSCHDVYLRNASERCDFVRYTEDCADADGYLNYMTFMFCTFQGKGTMGSVALSVLWLILLFIGLGVTADDFLCPALVVITKTLRLSQNIAGVTFLAFGNGAPDIFSSLAGIGQNRPELVIGTLFGAGIFVTTVVAGSIIASQPFKIMERPFLRDIIFYIFASYWAFFRFYNGEIVLWHSIGFVVLYCTYILVVIISRCIYQRYKSKGGTQRPIPTIDIQIEESSPSYRTNEADDPEAEGVVLRRFSFRASFSIPRKRTASSYSNSHHQNALFHITNTVDPNPNPSELSPPGGSRPPPPPLDTQVSKTSLSSLLSGSHSGEEPGPWKEFFLYICPVDLNTWKEKRWYWKLFELFKAPVYLVLNLTIPVVDYGNEKQNWCRLLNVLHCITSPVFVCFATHKAFVMIMGVYPVWGVVLVLSIALAILVFFTSKYNQEPSYHWTFGYLGFITSVMWVYTIATEIVSLLKTIGVVFKLSDAILGLTVLAWGNSIGDFISNLSVARQGYPRMGISACYGGPLLNLLLGVGIPYSIKLLKEGGHMELVYTNLISLLYATLCTSLVSTLVTMTVLRFQAKRLFGIYLIALYAVFLVTACLMESKVIFAEKHISS